MADRTCATCGHAFRYPSDLSKHRARKTPCALIVNRTDLRAEERAKLHECRFCNHRFASPSGLSTHQKKSCKVARSREGMEMLYRRTLELQHEKEHLARRLAEVTAQLGAPGALGLGAQGPRPALTPNSRALGAPGLGQAASAAPGLGPALTLVQNSANIVNGVQNNITFNVFGREQTSHINPDKIREILDQTLETRQPVLDSVVQVLIRAATLIFSDPQHPENLTCYIPNKKTDEVLIHGTAGWEIQSCRVVLPPMVASSCNLLFAKQPFVNADRYGDVMVALRDNEEAFAQGKQMRPLLVRNQMLLERALGALPR